MSGTIEVRYIEESDYGDWVLATRRGFLRPPVREDQDTSVTPSVMGIEPARTQGAFDGGRCVATFRTLPRELTVPGGAMISADAVSSVTVTATHRRRGLLSRMMARGLAAAKERGDAVSILVAAEYPIYGRFGFGPATWVTDWTVEIPRARLGRHELPDGARIDLVDGAEVRKVGPELHERVRRLTPGAINRTENFWKLYTGEVELFSHPWTEPHHAVYRDATGRVDGLLTYAIDDVWDGKMPQDTLTVRSMTATTPEAERALWRYALSVDWVVKLASGSRPPDDLLPLLLGDPRAARVTSHADFMWLRVLDAVTALEARGYAGTGELVLQVEDADGYADGRWRLTASPEGGQVRATGAEPDLVLDVRELGALYLGDESAVRLAALGRVEERRPGAAARADALLRTPRRPWCPETF
ncbi:GNAT family N-acetyltransferase [Streptantibioticus ferralitis]|uniref:GNAT family N-acetyltransferase n=1 Tax=Streptantibioticus ferralitis TaxID=236510 RepID=A0ABT5Z6S8_9ACTN|nr:GNAT family N-acetyltransferase [Streptantibioticus ferralitis]MDF2259352.1 GNAT family N-acetyltransferase [Streptantibioticus ferralitis]